MIRILYEIKFIVIFHGKLIRISAIIVSMIDIFSLFFAFSLNSVNPVRLIITIVVALNIGNTIEAFIELSAKIRK